VVHVVVVGYIVSHCCFRFDRGNLDIITNHNCSIWTTSLLSLKWYCLVDNVAKHHNMNHSSVKPKTAMADNELWLVIMSRLIDNFPFNF
jgi:hypothetical protein